MGFHIKNLEKVKTIMLEFINLYDTNTNRKYKLKGKTVHVKRDDLVGNGTTLPRWAKD